MNFSDDILLEIEDYLDGNMSIEAKRKFEKKIDSNKELKDFIEINYQMKLVYNEEEWFFVNNNEESEELKLYIKTQGIQNSSHVIKKVAKKYHYKIKRKRNIRDFSFLSIAACIIILLGFIFTDSSLTNQELYYKYMDLTNIPSLVSRDDSSNNDVLLHGEKAFLKKNYKQAEIYFAQFINTNDVVSPTVLIYLGISQLEINEEEKAISTFNKIIEGDYIDRSKGYWYKALLFLKNNDRERAINQLNLILKDSTNFNFVKSKDLLLDIEEP